MPSEARTVGSPGGVRRPAPEHRHLCSECSQSRSRARAVAPAARVTGIPEEESVARTGQRQTGARRTPPRTPAPARHHGDVASVLARTVREVEAAVQSGRVTPAVRAKFQTVALMLREDRARVPAAARAGSDKQRAEQLKRLDGIAAILAMIAVRDAGLLALL